MVPQYTNALVHQSTLDKAKSWVKELQRQANTDIVIALVGNKLDLARDDVEEGAEVTEENERQVPKEDAQAYADEAGLLFFETSAKTAQNVDNLFAAIGKCLDSSFCVLVLTENIYS